MSIYGEGSYCDLKSRFTVIKLPEHTDMILERFKTLMHDMEMMLDEFDSEHLNHSYMNLKCAMSLYVFFSSEEWDYDE